MIDFFLQTDTWVILITLTFLEIVLGIDNVIFISILVNKLNPRIQKKATYFGLFLAMLQRIALLFGVSFLANLTYSFFDIQYSWIELHISWQFLILLLGGVFLLYKSIKEIHEKIKDKQKDIVVKTKPEKLYAVLFQIVLIDFVFSIDSILTAIGMTSGMDKDPNLSLLLIIIAVIISIGIMMFYANPIREFVKKYQSIQILGLSFLVLIGILLITEAAHVSGTKLFNIAIHPINKGYLYFAIGFSLFVEFLNIKIKK